MNIPIQETVVEIEKVDKEEEDKTRQSQSLHWSLWRKTLSLRIPM